MEVEDTNAWVDIHNPKHEPELGDPNLVNTFAIMPDITCHAQKMPPPTNRSLKQGQAEQGQTEQDQVEQAQAKYVDDHTKDEGHSK